LTVYDVPFLTAPTQVVRAEVGLVVVTKKLDAATTVFVLSYPGTVETVPFTNLMTEQFGLVLGVTLATLVGITAILVAGEFGYRFCEKVRDVLGVEDPPYPCIAQHVTYLLASTLFVAAASWNLRIVLL